MDTATQCMAVLDVYSNACDSMKRKRVLESRKKFLEGKEAYFLSRKESLEEKRKLLKERRNLLEEKIKLFEEEVSHIEGEFSLGCKLLKKSVQQHLSSLVSDIDEKILSLDEIMELEETKYRLEYKIREKEESIEYLLKSYNEPSEEK